MAHGSSGTRRKSRCSSCASGTAVRDALSQAVYDASLSVHSVFGENLTDLYRLDRDWLENHLSSIFPEGEEEDATEMYAAAWDTYVIYSQQVLFDLCMKLQSQYERPSTTYHQDTLQRQTWNRSNLWRLIYFIFSSGARAGVPSRACYFPTVPLFENAIGEHRVTPHGVVENM